MQKIISQYFDEFSTMNEASHNAAFEIATREGIDMNKIIVATSFCFDELNHQPAKMNLPLPQGTFIMGGLIILWAEKRAQPVARVQSVDDMTPLDALKVGLVQCLGMIPGTSRSGATIIGGMLLGLSRKAATDFSFFLAIPTLVAAGGYSLWKIRETLSMADLPMFAVGLVVSFLSAWACVRWLLRFVSTHSFVPFAWYRIAFGIIVLATWWTGTVNWAD